MTTAITRLVMATFLASALAAQVITTIAGSDYAFPRNPIPALQAPLGEIISLAADRDGNLYAGLSIHHLIVRIAPSGMVDVLAGNGFQAFTGDGAAARNSALSFPVGIAVDASGNVFFSDDTVNRVRRVRPDGLIETYAGNGSSSSRITGNPLTSSIWSPRDLAVNAAGELFIAESGAARILKVTPDGKIGVVAGTGVNGYSGDGGPATAARFRSTSGLAVDAAGNLYIVDEIADVVRVVGPDGIIRTVAGNGTSGYAGDGGPATSAELSSPQSVAVSPSGELYIADGGNRRIRRVTRDGRIETVAGNGLRGFSGDGGPAASASLDQPWGIVFDGAGNLFIMDISNRRIRRVTPEGRIDTIAGDGNRVSPADGPASAAYFTPVSIAVDAAGNVFFSELDRVRRIDAVSGRIETIAGTGRANFSGDGGFAVNADLNRPQGVSLGPRGEVYIADSSNNRVRRIDTSGRIATAAGSGENGFSGDGGPATSAALSFPTGVAADAAGNLYITEFGNSRVRKVAANGIITTLAGDGRRAFSGDGGLATRASLWSPSGVAVDSANNVYITDWGNDRIRRVTPDGRIETIAGNGETRLSGDGGPATEASLDSPEGIAFDGAGNLLIADALHSRIRRVRAGRIETVAGTGVGYEFAGDGGPATEAKLSGPYGVGVDAARNIYIADTGNRRIRKILAQPPALRLAPRTLSFAGSSGGPPPGPQRLVVSASVPGAPFQILASAQSAAWLSITDPGAGARTPRQVDVSVDPANLEPGTYTATIDVLAPHALPAEDRVTVTFLVGPRLAPSLLVDKEKLSFAFPRSATPRAQTLSVANSGSGALAFRASAGAATGGSWLSVSPAEGVATPRNAALVEVSADASGLAAGTYSGAIEITAANGESRMVRVTLTVSDLDQAILLSQSGLSFTGVAGGGLVPPQTFGVLNSGRGAMPWSADTSVLSDGPHWLAVAPERDSTDASAPTVPEATVWANPSGLAPGRYYGLVQVRASAAANSPHVVTAFLDVLPPGENPGSIIQPAALTFQTPNVLPSFRFGPPSQELLIYNPTGRPMSFRSFSSDVLLFHAPTEGVVQPSEPLRVVVQPVLTTLERPGVSGESLTFQFEDGRLIRIPVRHTIRGGATSAVSAKGSRGADGCQPTQLIPTVVSIGQSFQVPAGWPAGLDVEVRDDCGEPMADGSVVVAFSNGDPAQSLQSLKNGRWQGTWQNRAAASATTTLRIRAVRQGLAGVRDERVDVGAAQDPPVIDPRSIGSAASPQPYVPLAPGSIISITGDRLATGTQIAQPPYPEEISGTQAIIAGRLLPILSVRPGQIDAMVPFDVQPNTTHQILVRRGATYSTPVLVDVAQTQPAILRGMITAVRGGERFLVTPERPVAAGDTLQILCTGLGVVDRPVPAGALTPEAPAAATLHAVVVRIGGIESKVAESRLTVGLVGIYQVTATVPEGVSGKDAPLQVESAGQVSPSVTLPVR